MGVRPPQQEDDGPELIEFGIPALAAELEDVELTFPAEQDELVRTLDDPEVPVAPGGHAIQLSTAFEHVSKRRFDSEQDLLNTLHPVFESYRDKAATGLVASLRSLLPF